MLNSLPSAPGPPSLGAPEATPPLDPLSRLPFHLARHCLLSLLLLSPLSWQAPICSFLLGPQTVSLSRGPCHHKAGRHVCACAGFVGPQRRAQLEQLSSQRSKFGRVPQRTGPPAAALWSPRRPLRCGVPWAQPWRLPIHSVASELGSFPHILPHSCSPVHHLFIRCS